MSESRYKALFVHSREATLICTREGEILEANLRAQALFGYSEEALRALSARELYVEGDTYNETIRQLKEERYLRLELRLLHKSGQAFTAELSLLTVDTDDGPVVLAMLRDISLKRLTELALVESESRLRSVLDGADVGYALMSPEMKILAINSRANELTRRLHGLEVAVGDDIRRFVTERRWSDLGYALQRALDGESVQYTHAGEVEPGTWFRLTVSPSRKQEGGLIGLVVCLEDVTEDCCRAQERDRRIRLQRALTTLSKIAVGTESITFVCWKALEALKGAMGPFLASLRLFYGSTQHILQMDARGEVSLQGVDELQWALSHSMQHTLREQGEEALYTVDGPGWPEAWLGREGRLSSIGDRHRPQGALWASMLRPEQLDDDATEALRGVCQIIASTATRLQTIQALRQSEQVLADAQRAAHIGSYSFDLVTQDLKWTEETHRIFAIPSDLGPPTVVAYLSRCYPEDRPKLEAAWADSVRTGEPFKLEHRICLPGGAVRWLQCTGDPIRNALGDVVRLAGTALDITERKESELELDAHRSHLASLVEARTADLKVANQKLLAEIEEHERAKVSLLENEAILSEAEGVAQMGTLIFDLETGEERLSAQALLLCGYEPGARAYTREDIKALVHPDDLRPSTELVWAALKGGDESFSFEYRLRRLDGVARWIFSRGRIFRNEERLPVKVVLTMDDVTERREMENRLRESLARERELSELKTRFVSMVSHEFRTPLATIQGAAQVVDLYGHRISPEEVKKQLNTIQCKTREMTALLEDILLLGRAESGRLKFNPSEVVLGDMVRGYLEELELGLESQHTIRFVEKERPIKARIDPNLFRHIFDNLLTNAVKYSSECSTVKVCLRRVHDPTLGPEGGLAMEVTDHGIGIPEADMERLFEPFHRAENVGAIRGTGLGLTVLHHAVSHHGGRIDVHSKVGHGSTFVVTLPCRPPTQRAYTPARWHHDDAPPSR